MDMVRSTIQSFHDFQILYLMSRYISVMNLEDIDTIMRFVHDSTNEFLIKCDESQNSFESLGSSERGEDA